MIHFRSLQFNYNYTSLTVTVSVVIIVCISIKSGSFLSSLSFFTFDQEYLGIYSAKSVRSASKYETCREICKVQFTHSVKPGPPPLGVSDHSSILSHKAAFLFLRRWLSLWHPCIASGLPCIAPVWVLPILSLALKQRKCMLLLGQNHIAVKMVGFLRRQEIKTFSLSAFQSKSNWSPSPSFSFHYLSCYKLI